MNSALLLQTQRGTSEIQVALIISAASQNDLPEPAYSLRYCKAIQKRHKITKVAQRGCAWNNGPLLAWNATEASSLLFIRGSLTARVETKSLAIDLIDLIQSAQAPLLWTLKANEEPSKTEVPSTRVLKYLTMQALRIASTEIRELVSSNFNAARIQSASTEEEWLEILACVLAVLPRVYIVIDADMLAASYGETKSFEKIFRLLDAFIRRPHSGTIKIVLFSYRKVTLSPSMGRGVDDRTFELVYAKAPHGRSADRRVRTISRSQADVGQGSENGGNPVRPHLLENVVARSRGRR